MVLREILGPVPPMDRPLKGVTALGTVDLLCSGGHAPVLVPVSPPGGTGLCHCRRQGLEAYGVPPDLVVGDFDSLGRRPSHPNVIQLPSAKDDTDMVYALREGLDRGFRRFVLLGGVGGRLEHTLANLQALSWLTTQGARGVLAGEGTVATVLRDETMTFPAGLTGFWSAFCLSGTAEGVTLRNLKFELTDHTISADFPLGVSNEFLEQPAQVSVRRGALLAMWREQGDFYRLLPQLWNREPIQHEGE